jgi:disulfide bond formation protein DsbB
MRNAAFAIFIVALLTIVGAWIFQLAGFSPCPLCLLQRWPYYAAIPIAALTFYAATRGVAAARWGLALLGLIMLGSGLFGIYHSGIEWGWWPGPTTCAGTISSDVLLPDLNNDPVITCEQAALRIFGLSLAGWNAVISLALAGLAWAGFRKAR